MASINHRTIMQGGIVMMVGLVLGFGLWYTPEGYDTASSVSPDFQFRGVTITQYEWERPVWSIEADRASIWRLSSRLVGSGLRVTMLRYPTPLVVLAGSGTAQLAPFSLRLSAVSGRYAWSDPLRFTAQQLEWSPSVSQVRLQGRVMIQQGDIRLSAGRVVMNMATHTIGVHDGPEVTVL